ncbi:MBL fold metallo-hydrolase [Candidatus Micrarchaeota archaeon]|nr:MBL fold metallo-hydrolase [Candidatus Micrarchaeota archaeon]
MTSLICFGGVDEIGGNKILLEDKSTRVWLDFGMGFGTAANFYSEFIGPKKCNGIGDYIALGLAPDLKGLYRQDYLKKMKRKEEEKEFDAILLTHAHFDHNGYFNLLRPDIPVYCSKGSECVMKMLDATSFTSEFLREKKSFTLVPKKRGDGLKRLDARDPEGVVEREVVAVNKKFSIGSLEVTPLPVDHSLPGALAYAIETSKGTIIYSGDFRFHGLNEEKTRKFVEKASAFEPECMICEGTRIDSENTETEQDVYEAVTGFCKDSQALVITNYPVRDTDRMATFKKAAEDNERKLVVSLKQAFLLKEFEQAGEPAPKLSEVNVYIPRKTWGLITEEIDWQYVLGDYDPWEYEFLQEKNAVTCKQLNENQEEFVWRCDFFELKELIDVKPGKTTKYVWSVTEPFDTKMELNQQIVMNWLNHFNINDVIHKHVSGHANGQDIKETIQTIKPKKLIPVHTEHAKDFQKLANCILPEKAEKIEL